VIHWFYRKEVTLLRNKTLQWFLIYMTTLLVISILGPFDGLNVLKFPYDTMLLFPVSIILFVWSYKNLNTREEAEAKMALMREELV
jgi:hypothetical protein